jgi:deaminated glutathione amidase
MIRVALVQYNNDADPTWIVAEAERAGAQIVVFPEMWSNGYAAFDRTSEVARTDWVAGAVSCDGPFVQQFRELAQKHRLHIVTTFLEKGAPNPFNTALLLDSKGRTALHHRKVFICDFDTPEFACGRGTGFATTEIETEVGPVKVGIMICMDREYPEAARALSRSGAEIVLVPNYCDLASDKDVGDVRIAQARGRAFEMVTGIAVAKYPPPSCDGHSFAADPTGKVIATGGSAPELVFADFDLEMIRRWRSMDHFRWDGSRQIGPVAGSICLSASPGDAGI